MSRVKSNLKEILHLAWETLIVFLPVAGGLTLTALFIFAAAVSSYYLGEDESNRWLMLLVVFGILSIITPILTYLAEKEEKKRRSNNPSYKF